MELTIHTSNETIRKVEDVIDIQKANGSLSVRRLGERVAGVRTRRRRAAARRTGARPDAAPSDSDVTVLRMRLRHAGGRDAAPGDGLHRPDTSSMVNLATLVSQSETSKHSLAPMELLLPLTSWERSINTCLHDFDAFGSKDSGLYSRIGAKSKLARFLRLYFCPCCTCLYKIERMCDEPSPSVYLTTKPVEEEE